MQNKPLTKSLLKEFVGIWDKFDSEAIAKKLGITKKRVSAIAAQIRKAGYELTYKRRNVEVSALIRETLDELGFPKKKANKNKK